jgi:hypothetical protein
MQFNFYLIIKIVFYFQLIYINFYTHLIDIIIIAFFYFIHFEVIFILYCQVPKILILKFNFFYKFIEVFLLLK